VVVWLRLISGLTLLGFLLAHLAAISLAIISLDALDEAWTFAIEPWRTTLGTIVLTTAFAVHLGIGLWSLYRSGRLRIRSLSVAQLALGLLIPALLAFHLIETRIAHELWDVDGWFSAQLLLFWVLAPKWVVVQTALLLVTWAHVCIGLHTWLRPKAWYATAQQWMLGLFTVIPSLALAGFVSGGMRLREIVAGFDPEWVDRVRAQWGLTAELYDTAVHASMLAVAAYGALVGGTLLAGRLRRQQALRASGVRVVYDDRITVQVGRGQSLLDALHEADVPHASVCGGKGRCSTCRVRIARGLETLASPSARERHVLHRIAAPPGVRLACQVHPTASLHVQPLLAPSAGVESARRQPGVASGEERELAILFCDLRGFTAFSETRLPYDVLFVLNRYFEAMGAAVEESGGVVDKFIGDEVMAVFGLDDGPAKGCRSALSAARRMADSLEQLNDSLADELDAPMRIAIGINVGTVIVGSVGYRRTTSFTAIGDAVNTASRLESLAKDLDAELVVAKDVLTRAELDGECGSTRSVTVRGHAEPVDICVLRSASELPEAVDR
jgi:adenylate cyclase